MNTTYYQETQNLFNYLLFESCSEKLFDVSEYASKQPSNLIQLEEEVIL